MNNYNLIFTIVILFNYCLLNVLAENNYYIVSILRNKNDNNYDSESEQVQNAIDKLVNDRMNEIYDIILENKDSYTFENGTMDEKLNELTTTSQLRNQNGDKKSKFLFINNNIFNENRSFNETLLIQEGDNEESDYIPIDSNLVSHICPVLNYYAIRVYLSDVTLKKIGNVSNVIGYEISAKDSSPDSISINDNGQYEMTKKTKSNITRESQENSKKFYDSKEILDKTHWKDVEVQEIQFLKEYADDVVINPLSVISQGQYTPSEGYIYDNNYYYPSSAGKGVDIYVVDTGLHISYSPEEFDTYEGTEDERTISCDGVINDGKFRSANATEKYDCGPIFFSKEEDNAYYHGTIVSIAAAGTLSGTAKKANIHVLGMVAESESTLISMDYIKKNGSPHKTIINFSFGLLPHTQVVQDKLNEMVQDGFIFILGAGNRNVNVCTTTKDFATYDGFITVGAVNVNDSFEINMKNPSYSINKSRYSDYGECLDIFAPGTIRVYNPDKEKYSGNMGTSFSSPFVAGVAATIISEHPEIQYDYLQMKQTLIDLSIKDIIEDLKDNTPNRLLNNGKQFTYQSPRCDHPSGKYSCGNNGCCSKYGFCVNPETLDSSAKPLCYIDNGCQSEFGLCYDGNCNHKDSVIKCLDDECCSVDGHDLIKNRYNEIMKETVNKLFNVDSISPLIDSLSNLIEDDVSWNYGLIDKLDSSIVGYVNHYTLENFKDNTNFNNVDYNPNINYNDANFGIKKWIQMRGNQCKSYVNNVSFKPKIPTASRNSRILNNIKKTNIPAVINTINVQINNTTTTTTSFISTTTTTTTSEVPTTTTTTTTSVIPTTTTTTTSVIPTTTTTTTISVIPTTTTTTTTSVVPTTTATTIKYTTTTKISNKTTKIKKIVTVKQIKKKTVVKKVKNVKTKAGNIKVSTVPGRCGPKYGCCPRSNQCCSKFG